MTRFLFGLFSTAALAFGASVAFAQTAPLEPCKPIPAGCKVIEKCECSTNHQGMTFCADKIQCPAPT